MTEKKLEWKVNTPGLIEEILTCPGTGVLIQPFNILRNLLAKVAGRAIKINDYELNKLMIQLALYSVGDPYSPDYNPEVVEKYMYGKVPKE